MRTAATRPEARAIAAATHIAPAKPATRAPCVHRTCHGIVSPADPETGIVLTRVVQSRGTCCGVARHQIGMRLYLWELLPVRRPQPPWVDVYKDLN